jgi:telomere length regulation protein
MITFLLSHDLITALSPILSKLKAYEQRKYFNAIVTFVAQEYLSAEFERRDDTPLSASPIISGTATLLNMVLNENELLKDHSITILTQSSLASLDDSLAARRAIIAALAQDEGKRYCPNCYAC